MHSDSKCDWQIFGILITTQHNSNCPDVGTEKPDQPKINHLPSLSSCTVTRLPVAIPLEKR